MEKLANVGYVVTRQKGSHIRLSRKDENGENHITIPDHDPIKIGVLSKILNDVAKQLDISREELLKLINE